MTPQEQEEIWLIEKFFRLYTKEPIKDLVKQESPDFIAYSMDNKIGIELTEVFQDSNNGPSRLQQNSSDSATFTDELIAALQPYVKFTFVIGINFSNLYPIKKSKRPELIGKIIEVCIPAMINLRHREHLDLDYYNGLPQEIDDIHLYRQDDLDYSFNSKPEGGVVGNLTIDHIMPAIKNKEDKLKKYLPCDQYWLIIREGNYYAGSFSELDLNLPLSSTFDKIFLLRTKNDELVELK